LTTLDISDTTTGPGLPDFSQATRDGSKQQKQKQKTTTTLGLIPEIGATARGYAAHLLSSHPRSDSSVGVSSATREQSWSSKTSWRFLKMVKHLHFKLHNGDLTTRYLW
jgi:hypothetical protein